MKRKKGFTLIEILIVVIILAILAAMILPRFLSQSENAYIAEASQVLGVLRRAEANASDLGLGYKALTSAEVATDAAMNPLGLKPLMTTNFNYECDANGKCKATSRRSGNNTIEMDIDGNFTCTGYAYVDLNLHSKGCKPNS